MKIGTKISLGFALAFILTGITVLSVTRYLTSRAMENTIGEEAHLVASQTMDSVDRIVYRRLERWEEFFDVNETVIKAVTLSNTFFSAMPDPQAYVEKQDLEWISYPSSSDSPFMQIILQNDLSQVLMKRAEFYQEKYTYKVFPEVFVTNKYGAVVASTNRTSDYNQADEEWWQKAKENGIYISNYQYDESSRTNSVEICLRVNNEKGEFIGVGKVVYDIKDILDVINEVKTNQNFSSLELSLIDPTGLVIYPQDRQSNQNIKNYLGNTSNYIVQKSSDGTIKLITSALSNGYKEFKGLGWVMLLTYDENEVLKPVNTVAKNITIVVGLATCLSILGAFIMSKLFVKPISKLQRGVEIVEQGNLDYQTNIKSTDEIGSLSRSFDKMVMAVKEARKDVDKKVEEQTTEIIRKNQELRDQQKAVLNVLEDVEEAKAKLETFALDLQKFKLAVDYTAEHIVITNPDGIILYANKAVTTITGFETGEILGKKAGNSQLWGGMMPKEVYELFWRTIKTQKKPFSGEFQNHRKNGEHYTAEANVAPVLNEKGEVLFFVGIERDVTRAKEIDRMKTEFISLASHQLRTPLSAMKWFSEMLLNGDAGKLALGQQEFVQNIYDSNERMIGLVSSLLNISRIESGRMIVDPQPTDLKELVDSVLKELQVKIKEKGHRIVTSIHDHLEQVNVDPKLIREVYKNLLTNAIKYTPANGEIHVIVSKKANEIISQVSDNGYGIPANEQAKIFNKFFRSQNIIKYESDGTGLGLYLVKAIIESSGGKVWFNSEEGKGTSFWISFPAQGMQAKKGEVSIDS
jgi:PAS domain S-box-containing protein